MCAETKNAKRECRFQSLIIKIYKVHSDLNRLEFFIYFIFFPKKIICFYFYIVLDSSESTQTLPIKPKPPLRPRVSVVFPLPNNRRRMSSLSSIPQIIQVIKLSRIVRKPNFAYAKTKAQISFAVIAKLISAFVFSTRIVQSPFFFNPKFQAASLLL